MRWVSAPPGRAVSSPAVSIQVAGSESRYGCGAGVAVPGSGPPKTCPCSPQNGHTAVASPFRLPEYPGVRERAVNRILGSGTAPENDVNPAKRKSRHAV